MAGRSSNDVAFDWDDEIVNDDQEFIILDKGDYNFTVTGFERGHFPGSAKMSPCNKAILTLSVNTDNGTATAKVDLIMNKVMEWKLSEFFRCIGQKKHGEKLKPRWNEVIGSQGRAHFAPREYTSKTTGNTGLVNDVTTFHDYDPKYFPAKKDDFMEVPDGTDDIPFE